MNLNDLPFIRIVSPRSHTAVVDPYGFPMEVEYEYDPGEPCIFWPTELAHPGSPPTCQLLSCKVNGQDIYEMLKPEQIERIEDSILDHTEQ